MFTEHTRFVFDQVKLLEVSRIGTAFQPFCSFGSGLIISGLPRLVPLYLRSLQVKLQCAGRAQNITHAVYARWIHTGDLNEDRINTGLLNFGLRQSKLVNPTIEDIDGLLGRVILLRA